MLELIWNNISDIYSAIGVVSAILSVGIFIWGMIISVLRLKLKKNQFKYLNLVMDKQTKQSMKYYIPTRIQNIDPNLQESSEIYVSQKALPFFIKNIFKNSESQYFFILADSGMGKTMFMLNLFFAYYKKLFRDYDIVLVPLALECSITKIKEIKNKTNTILLLDGFDEDKYAMNDYAERLDTICNETELFNKVIISCRTQFFSNSDCEPKYTKKIKFGVGKKSVEFIKYYISPFTNYEIDLYLKKKYNRFWKKNQIERSKKLIDRCPQLMIRPMLLTYIDDLLVDKTKEYKCTYDIYSELINKWVERESVSNKYLS